MVAAMRSHGGSVGVQEQGCKALSSLAFNDSNKVLMRKAGAASALQDARVRFSGQSPAVVEWAEKALRRL